MKLATSNDRKAERRNVKSVLSQAFENDKLQREMAAKS
jgi:hypothetical protein